MAKPTATASAMTAVTIRSGTAGEASGTRPSRPPRARAARLARHEHVVGPVALVEPVGGGEVLVELARAARAAAAIGLGARGGRIGPAHDGLRPGSAQRGDDPGLLARERLDADVAVEDVRAAREEVDQRVGERHEVAAPR